MRVRTAQVIVAAILGCLLPCALMLAPAAEDPPPAKWQTDYSQFLALLHELTERGTVPTEASLGEKFATQDSAPITDGAGGWIDFAPAEGTVQHLVNQEFPDKKVTWEVTVAHAMTEETFGVCMVMPVPSEDPAHAMVLWMNLPRSVVREKLPLKEGCKIRLDGVLGDTKDATVLKFIAGSMGVSAVYHLESAQRPTCFSVAFRKLKVQILETPTE